MVGPSKDRDTADATRKNITADPSLGMKSAWVIDWVPFDKRMGLDHRSINSALNRFYFRMNNDSIFSEGG